MCSFSPAAPPRSALRVGDPPTSLASVLGLGQRGALRVGPRFSACAVTIRARFSAARPTSPRTVPALCRRPADRRQPRGGLREGCSRSVSRAARCAALFALSRSSDVNLAALRRHSRLSVDAPDPRRAREAPRRGLGSTDSSRAPLARRRPRSSQGPPRARRLEGRSSDWICAADASYQRRRCRSSARATSRATPTPTSARRALVKRRFAALLSQTSSYFSDDAVGPDAARAATPPRAPRSRRDAPCRRPGRCARLPRRRRDGRRLPPWARTERRGRGGGSVVRRRCSAARRRRGQRARSSSTRARAAAGARRGVAERRRVELPEAGASATSRRHRELRVRLALNRGPRRPRR